jgi:glycosyltransferase involved in cell wall biosynthesis
MTTPWLLVAGDFRPHGGMDRANHALAVSLARDPRFDVQLVTHHASADLAPLGVTVRTVRRPLGAHLLGAPLLARAARRVAARLPAGARVVANGGNADTGDINWIHYLHAAHAPIAAGVRRRAQAVVSHRYDARRERRALDRARVIICNSQRTAADVQSGLGIDSSRVRVVYYGTDSKTFGAVSAAERGAARQALGWDATRPVAIFVGALGDRRKGFDRLLEAWRLLGRESRWDVDLAVVGAGSELPAWQHRAAAAGIAARVRFLGFRTDVPRLLAASDVLVHPARYEAYGLAVHEALCRGLPAIVSARAGVAERYPAELRDWLIDDVENADALAERLRAWRGDMDAAAARVRPFSERLRERSWDAMGAEFLAVAS